MFSLTSFLKDTLSLLAIVEPLGAIPVFLTLTASYGWIFDSTLCFNRW